MNEDPYESIAKECKITILQELKLGKCGFAFEPEREEPSPPCPVQLTGITMVSPPESDSEHVEEETFHTPPEHHQSRSVSSSDDPGPEIRPENNQVGQKSGGEDVVCDDDVSGCGVEVDLKGKKVDSKFTSENVELIETEPNVIELIETEPNVIEGKDVEMAEVETVDLSVEGNCENVIKRAECEKPRERLGKRNIEDLDAFRYVSKRGVGTRGGVSRRELPNSFKEQEVNEGLWVPRRSFGDNETFKSLMDAVGVVTGGSTDTDFFKAAKERGLEFPRPRWWPRDGVDDQVMD